MKPMKQKNDRRKALYVPNSNSVSLFTVDHQLSENSQADNDDVVQEQLIQCVPSNLHIIIRPNGHLSRTHCGNIAFLAIVAQFSVEYKAATSKLEKSILRNLILETIDRRGFKFIKQSSTSKHGFFEVDERLAWEKIGEALWIERNKWNKNYDPFR